MLFRLAAFALLLRSAIAVFADEAWTIDWHYALLGEPQESTTFFHRPSSDSRASLVYTLSEQHVVGALNPKDGAIVWRQRLSPISASNDTFLRAAEGSDIVVSGVDKKVSGRSAADGKLAWEYTAPGSLKDVEIYEFGNSKDAVALYAGNNPAVVRLDAETGAVKWRYGADSADTPYQVSVSSTTVYLVLLHKTILGYVKIKVVSLDPMTGSKRDEYTLSSENELASADTILTVGANSASPIIAWTDAAYSTIKVNVLGSKGIASFSIKSASGSAVTDVKLHAPFHANSLSHFLIHYSTAEDNWAEVFHIDPKSGKIDKAYKLPSLRDASVFSTSTVDANVYFTRISKHEISAVSSVSHGVLGKFQVAGGLGSFDREEAVPSFAISELSVKGDKVSAIRSAVWLSSGELVMLRDGTRIWQRPEALADTVKAWFLVPDVAKKLDKAVATRERRSTPIAYLERLTRHLTDLLLISRLVDSWSASMWSSLFTDPAPAAALAFGFDKRVICKTSKGVTFNLDVSKSGEVKYSCPASSDESIASMFPDHFKSSNGSTGATIDFQRKAEHLEAYSRDDVSKTPLWKFLPKVGESIIDVVPRPEDDPVASIGVALGDRRVLYKYLNSNLALVTTANAAQRSLTAHIIDTVSGDLLHASTHTEVDLSLPISAVISENWFAYSFSADSSSTSPRGSQLVSGELYESLSADDRGLLDAKTNYSSLTSNVVPFVLRQTYHIAEPISKLAVTRTRQSITTRQLLAVLPNSDSIIGIPRAAVDPRRPNRDPTKDEQMEGLVKYAPNLEFEPRWYLNHKREVLGIEDIVASPALLESTSIIFAYGHDIFGTRLSPSFNFDMLGKDFNKFQMLATVLALAVVTVLVAPLVARKQVNARWSMHT